MPYTATQQAALPQTSYLQRNGFPTSHATYTIAILTWQAASNWAASHFNADMANAPLLKA